MLNILGWSDRRSGGWSSWSSRVYHQVDYLLTGNYLRFLIVNIVEKKNMNITRDGQ